MRILMSGITGFIGLALGRRLAEEGHELVAVARDSKKILPFPAKLVGWDSGDLGAFDAVIHLAGEPIAARRWTAAQKKIILSSRVESAKRLARIAKNPPIFLSASGIGIYGDRGGEVLTENSPAGEGFLADVCREWEGAALAAGAARTVMLRTGMVLGRGGGALGKILPLFRAGLGGKLGHGRQWVSWIHLEDMVSLYLFALRESAVKGPVNSVAPEPVTNSEFTRELAKAVRRPAVLPAPSIALKIALGEMSSLLLESQRVKEGFSGHGFRFRYPELGQALREIVS